MNCFVVQFFQYGAKKKKPRGKNATLCPVTPYFSFPNFVMTYLICCAFSHKRRKKIFRKKPIKWKKIQSISPATHFFWLWAKPYLPIPPFSSKSKNIQLRNTTTRKRDKAEAWKKNLKWNLHQTASSAASAHEISKVVPKTYYLHTLDKKRWF